MNLSELLHRRMKYFPAKTEPTRENARKDPGQGT